MAFVSLICLFCFEVLRPNREIFNSYGDVTIADEGLQNLTYAQHLKPLSSKGSVACRTCCNRRHPFIMVNFEGSWHPHLLSSVLHWNCHYLFIKLRSVTAGIRTSNLPQARWTLNPTSPSQRFVSLRSIEINEKYILNAKLILMYMYFETSNESTISILYTYEMTLYPNIEKSIKMFPSRHISFTDQIQY